MRSRTGTRLVVACVVLAASVHVGILLAPRSAEAADDLGFRFDTNNVSVSECATSFKTQINSTVSDYDKNTDLTMKLVENACTLITYVQGDYGVTGWLGRAEPRNSPTRPCANADGSLTGKCNKTTYKAKSATIYLNTNGKGIPTSLRHVVMRHEMGHVFGLGHVDCKTNSVMRPGSCSSFPSTLQKHEKDLLNKWY